MSKERISSDIMFKTAEKAREDSRAFYKNKQLEQLKEIMEKIHESCSRGLYVTIIDKEVHPEIEYLLHQYGYRVNSMPVTVAEKQWMLSTHISWES